MVGMAIWNWHGVDMLVVALVGTSDNDKKKKEKNRNQSFRYEKESRNLLD